MELGAPTGRWQLVVVYRGQHDPLDLTYLAALQVRVVHWPVWVWAMPAKVSPVLHGNMWARTEFFRLSPHAAPLP